MADVPLTEKPLAGIPEINQITLSSNWENLARQGIVVGRFIANKENCPVYFIVAKKFGYGVLLLFEKEPSDLSKELISIPAQGDSIFIELLMFENERPTNILVFSDSGKVEFYDKGEFK